MHTIANALLTAQQKLVNSETSRLDAEVLLGFVLQRDRAYLYTWPERELTTCEQREFMAGIERRARGEPVAYIAGHKDFWRLTLQVDRSTLIPRPETELLVELALQHLPETPCQVLDLGTGSGAIALALASERKAWHICACDISEDAVRLAIRNRQALGISNLDCFRSHWFEQVPEKLFDLIVSNPPYIDEADEHLLRGDVRFEPRSALVAEKHGLGDIEKLSHQALSYLKSGGWIMFEHGFAQAEQVRTLLKRDGYSDVNTVRDLAGHERVTMGKCVGGKK